MANLPVRIFKPGMRSARLMQDTRKAFARFILPRSGSDPKHITGIISYSYLPNFKNVTHTGTGLIKCYTKIFWKNQLQFRISDPLK